MIDYNEILTINPFGMPQHEKNEWYLEKQKKLTLSHYERSEIYRRIVDRLSLSNINKCSIDTLPFLPARLFKYFEIKSTNENKVERVLTSSGTSGGPVSKIYLDRKSIFLQSRALKGIFNDFFPNSDNLTMFVMEAQSKANAFQSMQASGAAIRGFSQFAKKIVPIRGEDGFANFHLIEDFLNEKPDDPFVIFGFTAAIWRDLIVRMRDKKIYLNKNNGIVLHGGGWKKMLDQAVSKVEFTSAAKSVLGVACVHDYYGMVEQTGSVFVECDQGYFHSSIYSEVMARNENLEVAEVGEVGLLQVMSLLPDSYPGHNLITDDIGVVNGLDHCLCGRRGKYFSVIGRAPGTELRGCSDAS